MTALSRAQAGVIIEFTVTRPDAFELATEAARVIDVELAKLPGSRLVEMKVGPAREFNEDFRAERRQWTAECRAVLSRG